MIAIDTNVFVYAFDAADPIKQTKSRELFERVIASADATAIPWQVAVELLARFRKWESAGKMTAEEVRDRFREFLDVWPLTLPTAAIFERSFRVHERYSLSHWDSLLIAACQEAAATRLYTEDMQDGADYDGVKIINPFQ